MVQYALLLQSLNLLFIFLRQIRYVILLKRQSVLLVSQLLVFSFQLRHRLFQFVNLGLESGLFVLERFQIGLQLCVSFLPYY